MSVEFIIDASFNWHFLEQKEIAIRVTDANGDPVDLAGRTLRWALARAADSPYPYIIATNSGEVPTPPTGVAEIAIEAHEDDEYGAQSVARISLDADSYDYMARHGVYRHELKDITDGLVLSFGPATLLPAMQPASEAES